MRAGRARTEGRAAMGARKAAALAKGRRKRAFMVGYLELSGSARCCGGPIGGMKLAGGELTHWTTCTGPREMSSDGVAIAGRSVVLVLSSAKARTVAGRKMPRPCGALGTTFTRLVHFTPMPTQSKQVERTWSFHSYTSISRQSMLLLCYTQRIHRTILPEYCYTQR